MAAADKLWIELGVRDEISAVLEKLMRNSENLANALTNDVSELKNVYRNIVDISNIYDKIYVAQKRISELKGISLSADEKKGLKDMGMELEKVRKQFSAIFKNPDRLQNKGEVQFDKMRLNFELLLKDTLRYVDNIEAKDRAEAINAANESKRIDDLKSKYYELQRYRKQLSDAIANAAPGTNIANSVSLINSISARMSAVNRAQRNGTGLPSSTQGADYEEFLRKLKAEIASLTSATDDYNRKLESNRQLQASLKNLKADAQSQQTVAGIRRQTAEYTALGRKIQEINSLISELQADEARIIGGGQQTYNKSYVNERLNAIQRSYNESLAVARQRELDDASAKNQKSAATRKAMEAVSALANVNDGLISSYNRVAEAGSQASRISIQFQNQIGAYAGLYGLERIVKSIVTIGGQFEVQHVALQNILGDVEQANILFGQLKELAIESPKTFMELTSYAKQLSAYQIPANELYDTTKRLADMSSGLGVDMNRLILAYGQVRSAAVLRGQELRQFTEAGIPMVQALADKFTEMNGKLTTTADVFKLISQRAVPFEMVKEVLWDMTSQGGQFYNMQSELANTLYGKWQKLQDSWQIMLGSIAEGTNASGIMFKGILDFVVAITQHLDKLVPLLTAIGVAKGVKGIIGNANNIYTRRTGEMAIENMRVAKLKEANRLERERLWYGKQLTAEEQQIVNKKNQLVSSDYQILALENQISAKKAYQLMKDGQITKQHYYRYLQMQGYTREQRKQIALGNLQALRDGPNPQPTSRMGKLLGVGAKGALSFFGGWIGVAITALGAATSIYQAINEADERLSDMANSISGNAQQNANQLANTLKNVGNSSDESFKKVEALEEALLASGVAGKQIVQDSRGFDDMSKRLEMLTENAKAYQQALEAMGSPSGKSAIKEALDKSNLNDEMDEYEDLQNEEYKRMSALERYSAKYQQMIDALKSKHKELEEQLNGKNLYENIRLLLTGGYANETVGHFAGNTPWGDAITKYAKAVEESEAHLQNIKNNVIPDAMNELRSLARQAGVDVSKNYEDLTEAEKTKLRTIATNFANGLEKGSQDAKDSIASWVAQGFYAPLYLTPVINTNELTGLPYDLDEWQKGKGYNLWSKNDLKEANTDFLTFSKKQSQRKVDREKQLKNLSTQLNNPLLDPDIKPYIQDQKTAVENELKELNDSLKEGKWTFDKSLTKGNKKGDKTDEQLKRWKEEWGELKAFYSEYKKWAQQIGNDAALKKLRETGLWGQFFNADGSTVYGMSDWGKAIGDFRKKLSGGTTERTKFLFEVSKEQLTPQYDEIKKAAEAILSQLDAALKEQGKKWNLYKKVLEATGDKSQAAQLAFGGQIDFGNQAEQLRSEIAKDLLGNSKAQGFSIDKLLGMNDEALRNIDIFKENTDGVYQRLMALKDAEQQLKSEDVELFLDALKNAKSLETELAQIENKYNRTRNAIKANGGDPTLLENANKNEAREKADARWKYFKQDEDWGRIFGNLDKMSTQTLRNMRDNLTALLPNITASEEATKALYEALAKIDQVVTQRNPFSAIGNALGKAIRLPAYSKQAGKGDIVANSELSKLLGVQLGSKVTKKQIDDEIRGAEEDFVKGLDGISKKFKAVQDVLQPVIDLFDQLGMKEASEFFQTGSNALGAASQVAGGLNALGLGSLGPYGAAAAAGISMVSSIFALHDKALQEEIDASKQRQKEMENLTKNLETALERTLGGVYNTKASAGDIKKLQEYQDRYTIQSIFRRFGLGGFVKDDTSKAVSDALSSETYYDTKLAELYIQRDEIRKQMELEQDKKNSDDGAIEDYKQQLAEMQDQIENFALDMAKAIYDIDIKSWAKDLSDAVVTAWENGEDAVEAYTNTVKSKMKDLSKNILAQKVMEKALDNAGIDDMIAKMMDSTNGKLDLSVVPQLATALGEAGNKSVAAITAALDELERQGYISKGDGASSSSTSKAIQGNFTEQETGLLVSYINSIRADVSTNRITMDKILTAVLGMSSRNMLTEAQESYLRNIAAYTKRNADAAEAIYELLHRVSPDGQSIKVK